MQARGARCRSGVAQKQKNTEECKNPNHQKDVPRRRDLVDKDDETDGSFVDENRSSKTRCPCIKKRGWSTRPGRPR